MSDTADRELPPEGAPRVVYCGGCNPHIDRAAVAAELVGEEAPAAPATVFLSGCQRACASDHRLVGTDVTGGSRVAEAGASGERVAVVAGELVDGVPTPAADIGEAVKRTLKE